MVSKINKLALTLMLITGSMYAAEKAKQQGAVKAILLPSPAEMVLSIKHIGIADVSQYIKTNVKSSYQRKSKYAAAIGTLSTDLFFYALAGKKSNIKDSFAQLMSLSKKIGLKDVVNSYKSKKLKTYIENKNWVKLMQRLEKNRQAMELAYKDKYRDDLATIIEVAGWMEAMTIISDAVASNYSKEQTDILHQASLAYYLQSRLKVNNSASVKVENELLSNTLTKVIKVLSNAKKGLFAKKDVLKLQSIMKTYKQQILK